MYSFKSFFAKEIWENIRTKKVLALGIVFLMFAMSGPLLARFMGEFLELMLPAGDDLAYAMLAAMGNPVWQDAFLQYYSNLTQIGLASIIFIFMGLIQREVKSGTSSLMFSKGLGFKAFVLAKFTSASLYIMAISIISGLVAFAYTFLLFEEAGNFLHVMAGALVFGLGSIFIVALVIMCSAFSKSSAIAGGLSFGAFILFLLIGAIPQVGQYSPYALFNQAIAITMGYVDRYLWWSLISAIAIGSLALVMAISRLKRAEG